MIISHHHRFVFLRSCKTGSTSTALALRMSGLLDPRCDVSSVIEGPRESAFHVAMNLSLEKVEELDFADAAPHLLVWPNPAKRLMHVNLPEVIALGLLSPEQAATYDVYVAIREPVDKMISSATFLLRDAPAEMWAAHGRAKPQSVQEVFDQGSLSATMPILEFPQSHWFQTAHPKNLHTLLFDDLAGEITRLITGYGGSWTAENTPREKTNIRDKTIAAEQLLRHDTLQSLRETYRDDYALWTTAQQRAERLP